jgi:hypothetical protein
MFATQVRAVEGHALRKVPDLECPVLYAISGLSSRHGLSNPAAGSSDFWGTKVTQARRG